MSVAERTPLLRAERGGEIWKVGAGMSLTSVKKVTREAGIGWLVRHCYERAVSSEEKMT